MPAKLYPEGASQLNVIVSTPVKQGIANVARRQHRTMSQLVAVVLEDWLRERGELPIREPEEVTASP